jgi:hypothetical protein
MSVRADHFSCLGIGNSRDGHMRPKPRGNVMTEERITETRTPDGDVHTHTTVITDQPRSGGGFKWFGLLVLIVAAVAAVLIFTQMSDAEVAKDNAVAGAAEDVGNAAGQVGDAAEQAIDEVTE